MATTDSTLNIADPGNRTGSRSRPKSTMDIQSSMKGIMSKVRETYSEESPLKKQQRILADWSANWDSAISESFGDESSELKSKKEEIIDVSPKAEAGDQVFVRGDSLPLREGGVDYTGVENITDLIKKSEGLRLKAYGDIKQTSIGYGSKGKPGEVITEEEANRRLANDIKSARNTVIKANERHGYEWNSNQIDALTSFVHNLGPTSFNKLIDNGTRGNEEILEYLPQYNKAALGKGGELVELKGLTERRKQEVKIFTQGYGS